ncbi:MAG: transcriptional regulator [Elusimicrobia bacterium]|nr:transcriptional regulator [Elusimicrobiota bacterium]MDE2236828.1 transcriptional regulator [Elusimicrobiota bacterium]MDE2425387.1 transcriptional regulator [Elusimicrobiota bacterium]
MAKNKDYSKKLFRLVRILNQLESDGQVTTRELADDFNVTIRTAQRDIELINMAQFPVMPTAKGAYSFTPGFSLKRLPLTNEEASLLAFLCEVAQSMGPAFAKSFRSLLAKATLSADGSSPFHAIVPVTSKRDLPAVADLKAAVEENREVEIRYLNGRTYRLQPLKIVHSEGFWYLAARIGNKSGYTTFRLDRIESVQPTPARFKPPHALIKRLGQATSIWSGREQDVRVVLRVDEDAAEYFESASFFPQQKKLKALRDGSLLLEARITHFMQAIPVIQRWIPHIHVVQPKTLRDRVRKAVRGYLKEQA